MLGTGALAKRGATTIIGMEDNCIKWGEDVFTLELHGDHAWLQFWYDRKSVDVMPVEEEDETPAYLQPFDPEQQSDRQSFDAMSSLPDEPESKENEAEMAAATQPLAPGPPSAPIPLDENDIEILEGAPVHEGRVPRGVLVPRGPSNSEKEKHELTHWPFRAWCGWCVQSRAHANQHRTNVDEERIEHSKNMLQCDYFFMRTVYEQETVPCLSAIERRSGAIVASVVPARGANDFIVNLVFQALEKWGMNNDDLIIQCDQEDAVVNIVQSVARKRTASTTIRRTPKGS